MIWKQEISEEWSFVASEMKTVIQRDTSVQVRVE